MDSIILRPLLNSDYKGISRIYAQGIATGMATFETEIPDWNQWDQKYLSTCRIVAECDAQVVGFAVLSQVSKRYVYRGVAEVSLYVADSFRRKGIGEMLLRKLIKESENEGFWTLQAGIFPENKTSINLHLKCGFRIVGSREKIGQLHGQWHDNTFMERRSHVIGT